MLSASLQKTYKYKMSTFERDLLLGRIGEHIVERILSKSGFRVIHYGYERVVPSVVDALKNAKSEVAVRIRSAPDYLVMNKADEPFLVQVKATLKDNDYFYLKKENYPEKYHWPQAVFIIVNLGSKQKGVYVVERWRENTPGRVYVYYDKDSPTRGCSTPIEKYSGFGQSISSEIVEEVMTRQMQLLSQLKP